MTLFNEVTKSGRGRIHGHVRPGFPLSPSGFSAILAGMFRTQDLHVREIMRLLAPAALKTEFPITDAASATVARGREAVTRILRQEDPRLLVVVGPCSIHDVRRRDGIRRETECAPPGIRRPRWKS